MHLFIPYRHSLRRRRFFEVWARTALLAFAFCLPAHGVQLYEGVDIAPAVAHFRKQVVTLNKSVTTFNWVGHGEGDFWDKERPQNDPSLLREAKISADVFWGSYGSPEGANNMYGSGLYTATDPRVTRDFGGTRWRLTVLRFPVGTRILDLANPLTVDVSDESLAKQTESILDKFFCPQTTSADPLFVVGGGKLSPQCRGLVKEIFNRTLQIDAFAYSYSGSIYKACEKGIYHGNRAFVVTRPDWITSELVRYYTTDSRLNEPDRILIQTLFAEGSLNPQNTGIQLNALAEFLKAHPEHDVDSSSTTCEEEFCTIEVTFCDPLRKCESIKLPPLVRPGGPLISDSDQRNSEILWKDLLGKPKAKTTSTWLNENRFGCTGELPYDAK